MALLRIIKELKEHEKQIKDLPDSSKIPEIAWGPMSDDLFDLRGIIVGPAGTPYEGGMYYLEIKCPEDYPLRPPMFRMTTKIYHPNINGVIGTTVDYQCWSPSCSITKVCQEIIHVLKNPTRDGHCILNLQARKQFKCDLPGFLRTASAWSMEHAEGSGMTLSSASALPAYSSTFRPVHYKEQEDRDVVIRECLSDSFGEVLGAIFSKIIMSYYANRQFYNGHYHTIGHYHDYSGRASLYFPQLRSEDDVQIYVKTLTGKTMTININLYESSLEIKCAILDQEGIPPWDVRLIYAGKQLNEDYTLFDYGIRHETCLHMPLRCRGTGFRWNGG